jgi:hypothetical protein
MSTARVLNFLFFGLTVLEDVFEGGLEGMDGEIGLGSCLEKLQAWLAAAVILILIKKVGRCCYVRSSVQVCKALLEAV